MHCSSVLLCLKPKIIWPFLCSIHDCIYKESPYRLVGFFFLNSLTCFGFIDFSIVLNHIKMRLSSKSQVLRTFILLESHL